MIQLNAKELRTIEPDPAIVRSITHNPITIILDNVLDTYNVGSIFRLADAVAAERVFLCGQTLTPPNSRIKKASINTTGWVQWEYKSTALEAIEQCKVMHDTCQIIAVEQDKRSKPFDSVRYRLPVAIVVGNETTGVSREVLDKADMIVELPMWGINKSLNVMVSCGIILYEIIRSRHEEKNPASL
ncbi:TrmH family RNA methyltransferase [Candidatus Gottesmanbacteria bacterium]|nr:TrmH family RNA methyltransferase [Candidatus Gottesmanbacteria bacterium]